MKSVAFVLDNYRLMHVEQFDAVAEALGDRYKVVGLELFSGSHLYEFGRFRGNGFEHVTLFDKTERSKVGILRGTWRIVSECLRRGVKIVFISHYERPYIFLASTLLRCLGRRVYVITDSKFDDYARVLWREVGKWLMYKPYHGAIAASRRSADYLRFLGIPSSHIHLDAYTTCVARVQGDAKLPPAPGGEPFARREFVCIARLVDKKNHFMLLDAYARYARTAKIPRPLVLCGSGPLEPAIRSRIAELGIERQTRLAGNLPAPEVAAQLGKALCLILPSIEEQFGIVVLEAQAMGLPVILTIQCGARDRQVRTAVNGFVVEEDNAEGLAAFLRQLDESEALWREMSERALDSARQSDVSAFVTSALRLIDRQPAIGVEGSAPGSLDAPPTGS